MRTRLAAVLSPAVLLGACSGDSDDGAEPAPSASSASPSPSGSATAPTSSASPGPDLHGVEVEVVSLDEHASDPVVSRARELFSAMARSSNGGAIVPELRQVAAPAVVRSLERTYRQAWANDWVLPETPMLRVASSEADELELCVWNDSQAYRTRDATPSSPSSSSGSACAWAWRAPAAPRGSAASPPTDGATPRPREGTDSRIPPALTTLAPSRTHVRGDRMLRRTATILATAALCLSALAACSGDDDAKADPTPSPSETTSATPTPSPTPTALQPDLQGVDVRITNLADFQTDPVVAQFQVFASALVRSVNSGKQAAEIRTVTSTGPQKFLGRTFTQAWQNDWRMPNDPLFYVAVSDGKQLKVCVRNDTQAFRTKAGKLVQPADRSWLKLTMGVTGVPDAVRFTSYDPSGTCKAPGA